MLDFADILLDFELDLNTFFHPVKTLIYRHPRTRFWQARFPVWDSRLQTWKQHNVSTKVVSKSRAQTIADTLAEIALKSGPDGKITRDHVVDSVNHILRIAGHREVIDQQSWKDYSARWLEAMSKRVPRQLSKGTYATYVGHLKCFDRHLGADTALPLGSLTAEHVQGWYRAQIEGGLAVTTVNNMATTLSTIFERAKDEGFTTRNPVNLLTRDDHVGNQRDPFTEEDQHKILAYLRADKSREDWLTVALLGLCTSQRLRDCADAVRSAFEFGNPFIIWTIRQAKTKKTLRIPIVEPAASHIERILRRKADSLFLAPSLAGCQDTWQDGLSAQFAAILEAAGVKGRHIAGKGKGRSFNSKTFHSTRHTCNTALARAGVPVDVRKLITGHADAETNIIYTHLDDATKAKALTKAFKRKA